MDSNYLSVRPLFNIIKLMYATIEEDRSKGFSRFKTAEKRYKYYKKKQTDFSEVIILDPVNLAQGVSHSKIQDPKTGRVLDKFEFDSPAGLIIVKDYSSPLVQARTVQRALNSYIAPPHRTNLYIYSEEYQADDKKLHNPSPYNLSDYKTSSLYSFNTKIRWSNIGRQYNWDERNYFKDSSPIPSELIYVSLDICSMLNLGEYSPEALIVNYYGMKNVMGGHLDDGEPDQLHPIISLSFGLSCVFLIGGKTKDDPVTALRLDSGDVMIMGKEARKCFHGVPRVIEGSLKPDEFIQRILSENPLLELDSEEYGVKENENLQEKNTLRNAISYMSENRLNINFRQVQL